jgi:hypothetical protein
MTPIIWQRGESVLVAALVVFAAVHLGIEWWLLFALFLAFDLSAVGYLRSPRLGAAAYNAIHNYAGPAASLALWLALDVQWLAVLGLAWGFHVAVDRALGYGLKHDDAFEHTHLGWIGRRRGGESSS